MKVIVNFFLSHPLLSTFAIALLLTFFSIETIHSQPLYSGENIHDVAIIGGGVSGCYCAWRLAGEDSPKRSIHLYEMSDRIGGRLYTVFLPGMPNTPVEIGGMHFNTNHLLTYNLASELGLEIVDYLPSPIPSDNFVYLRGKRFRANELSYQRVIPYDLTHHEEGKTPQELIYYALENLIPNISKLTADEWKEIKDDLKFNGQSIKDASWQNFLASVLSSEAYQFLVDTGTIQVVNNLSILTQVPLYMAQAPLRVVKITTGLQDIPSNLVKKFEEAGGVVHKEHRLHAIQKVQTLTGETVFKLSFEETVDEAKQEVEAFAKNVILAMPKRSLELLDKDIFLFQDEDFSENLNKVNAYPLTKLFFGYADPWWRKLGLTSGKSISDFELRTTHYFQTEEETPKGDKINTNALLLASYQGARTPFWKGFSPGDPFEGKKNFHVPPREDLVNKKLAISNYAVAQTQRMLKVLHGINTIPDPYTAAYFDWSKDPYGGAYYHWKVGVDPETVIKEMRKPLSNANVYICGCTFTNMQGWIEGALKSAELVLEENFDLKQPAWLPEGYKLEP